MLLLLVVVVLMTIHVSFERWHVVWLLYQLQVNLKSIKPINSLDKNSDKPNVPGDVTFCI